MTLLRPFFLLLLLPWLLWLFWAWRRQGRTGGWSRLIAPELLRHLAYRPGGRQSRSAWIALGLAGALLILALAGPARPMPAAATLSQGSLVVVLDTTLSMAAEDITPNRLARARRSVLDWAGSGLFQRTAVLIYSSSAHWLAPFTADVETLALQLDQLDPFIMPSYGNRPDRAFAALADKQRQLAGQRLHLLWLTDDASPDRLDAGAERPVNGRIWIMPVGTEAGGPIPLPGDDGFVTDGERLAVPGLDRAAFEALAGRLDARLLALDALPRPDWLGAAGRERSGALAVRDLGPWLLPLALVLLLPWYRRGLIFVLPLLLWMPPPATAEEGLLNREQRAYRAWQAGEPERARQLTRRPALAAQAAFEAGDLATAIELWRDLDSADAHYNRGNALVHQGRLRDALAAYDQALASGEHPAARHNRQRVADFLDEAAESAEPRDPGPSSAAPPAAGSAGRPADDRSEPSGDPSSEAPAPGETPDDASGEEVRRQLEQAQIDQLLNRVPAPRARLLERKLKREFERDPVPQEGESLW